MKTKTIKWLCLIAGLLMIIGGILYSLNPVYGFTIMVRLVGVILVITGIIRIIRYFNSEHFSSAGFLISGILDILLGILIFVNISASVFTVGILVPFWVLFKGITEIVSAFEMKKKSFANWWVELASGILGTILGFIMVGNFGLSAFYVTIFVSFYMIALGTNLIYMFFIMSKLEK